MRVAIITTFQEFNPGYSLTGIVSDQIRMLQENGHEVTLFVCEQFNASKYPIPQVDEIKQVVPFGHLVDYRSKSQLTSEHDALADTMADMLLCEMPKYDIIFTHDIVFTGWNYPYALGVQRAARRLERFNALHWIHSVPSGERDIWEIRAYAKKQRLVYPNKTDVIRVAEQFRGWPDDVVVIPHIKDPRSWFEFCASTCRFIQSYPLVLEADVVQALPAASDRLTAKRVREVSRIFGHIKGLGRSVCLVVANQWATTKQHREDVQTYLDAGREYGLEPMCDYIFTSECLHGEHSLGLPRRMLRELMMLSNILNALHTYADAVMTEGLVSGSYAAPWWKVSYVCNQFSVNIAGLLATGLATFDNQTDDAPAWIQAATDKLANLYTVRASDGAHVEGLGYWGYDLDRLLPATWLLRQLLSIDHYATSEWLENTGMFRLYLSLPRNSWVRSNTIGFVTDFNDSVRINWYGPDYLLRGLAKEYANGYLQWLADEVDNGTASPSWTDDSSEWLNLLWLDDTLAETAPTALPTLKWFDDLDMVSMRSSWAGDESLVVFQGGPPDGHRALTLNLSPTLATAHEHPAAGHISLFGAGEWQLRDDSYYKDDWATETGTHYAKFHNTLSIGADNATGTASQYTSSQVFTNKATTNSAAVSTTSSSATYDMVKSNLAAIYSTNTPVTKFDRILLYLKPDILIVLDDVELPSSQQMNLRFHTENTIASGGTGVCTAAGTKSNLRIENLSGGGTVDCGDETYLSGMTRHRAKITKTDTTMRTATAISWATGTPVTVTLRESGNQWVFLTSDDKTITYDWDTGTVTNAAGVAHSTHTGGKADQELIMARGPTDSWQTVNSISGPNNLFVENCIFGGSGYVSDINSNGRAVFRWNTITGNNKIDGHGKCTNTPNRSVRHIEIYNNRWTLASGNPVAMALRREHTESSIM